MSATAIRRDPFSLREYLHPRVYRDLITNVVFLGAPSTGKTTLAAHMAHEFATVWMPEYGREYWERHHAERRLTPEQLVEIAEGHLQREEALIAQADRYPDVRRRSVIELGERCSYWPEHAQQIARLSTALFDGLEA